MKKKFRFYLEIEKEFETKKLPGKEEVFQYLNLLIKEAVKHDTVLLEYMQFLILNMFFNFLEVHDLLGKDDKKILEPVIKTLPTDAQEFFHKIFTTSVKESDYFYDNFLSCFGRVLMTKLIFNNPESDQDFPNISINKPLFI